MLGSSFQRKGARPAAGRPWQRRGEGGGISRARARLHACGSGLADTQEGVLTNLRPIPLCADPCTRPGPQGLTVVSSGLADLDQVLGGGLPLGAITLLLDDGCSSLHETIIQYFLAEGAVTGQVTRRGGPLVSGRNRARRPAPAPARAVLPAARTWVQEEEPVGLAGWGVMGMDETPVRACCGGGGRAGCRLPARKRRS